MLSEVVVREASDHTVEGPGAAEANKRRVGESSACCIV
jgi:hypothetical protein